MIKVAGNEPLHQAELSAVLEQEARDKLEGVLKYLREGSHEQQLHEVERGIFYRLLELGLILLKCFLARKGTGKVEGRVDRNGVELPYHATKSTTYFSIFGTLEIERAYYWAKGQPGWFPLAAELNLPENRYSYLLQEWAHLIGVKQAYDEVTEQLEKLLRVKFWKQGVQKTAQSTAGDVEGYYEEKAPPQKEDEGQILVATVDGKGVPIRREEPRPRKIRLAKGEKPNKKKEAVVTAVYTVDPYERSVDDVVREIDQSGAVVEPVFPPPERPEPQNKRVHATLKGKDHAFEQIQRQLDERDPQGAKERVVLTDGADALLTRAQELSGPSGIVIILDIMHVLSYLWTASTALHSEGSADGAKWVMAKLRLLLQGKVGYLIGGLRQSITKRGLKGRKRRVLEKAINYMENRREYMRYDTYLARGYPIATGVVEGTCRHLVKDRMECTGMRWTIEGAQAILDLRAVEINDDWEDFWHYRVTKQHERLYGKAA